MDLVTTLEELRSAIAGRHPVTLRYHRGRTTDERYGFPYLLHAQTTAARGETSLYLEFYQREGATSRPGSLPEIRSLLAAHVEVVFVHRDRRFTAPDLSEEKYGTRLEQAS
jgi:hypothetical protein